MPNAACVNESSAVVRSCQATQGCVCTPIVSGTEVLCVRSVELGCVVVRPGALTGDTAKAIISKSESRKNEQRESVGGGGSNQEWLSRSDNVLLFAICYDAVYSVELVLDVIAKKVFSRERTWVATDPHFTVRDFCRQQTVPVQQYRIPKHLAVDDRPWIGHTFMMLERLKLYNETITVRIKTFPRIYKIRAFYNPTKSAEGLTNEGEPTA